MVLTWGGRAPDICSAGFSLRANACIAPHIAVSALSLSSSALFHACSGKQPSLTLHNWHLQAAGGSVRRVGFGLALRGAGALAICMRGFIIVDPRPERQSTDDRASRLLHAHPHIAARSRVAEHHGSCMHSAASSRDKLSDTYLASVSLSSSCSRGSSMHLHCLKKHWRASQSAIPRVCIQSGIPRVCTQSGAHSCSRASSFVGSRPPSVENQLVSLLMGSTDGCSLAFQAANFVITDISIVIIAKGRICLVCFVFTTSCSVLVPLTCDTHVAIGR
jgi:hypothetical protein